MHVSNNINMIKISFYDQVHDQENLSLQNLSQNIECSWKSNKDVHRIQWRIQARAPL